MASLTQLSKRLGLFRWLPFVVTAVCIFYASSRGGDELPSFGVIDFLVKKGGHITGYFLLAATLRFALEDRLNPLLVYLTCMVYALSDEFHQSFSVGRTATLFDVMVYDQIGILLGGFGDKLLAVIRTLVRNLHH